MSLAPSERRALARIEILLRSSDPGLATMLATFTHPAHRTGWFTWRRIKQFIPVTVAMAVIGLVILGGVLLGHSSRSACGADVSRDSVAWQLDGCSSQTAAHRIGSVIAK